ncbi:MAG: molecular chaperone DnaJ [Pseudomonadota bacterium]
MAKRDYYEILGVEKTADAGELKKAYRKKAMKYHPDRNPDDKDAETKFKELNEAYDVLKDEQKRAAYDRFGHGAFEGGMGGGGRPGAGGMGGMGGMGGAGFSDIFEEMFGDFMGGGAGGARGGNTGGAKRGADLSYELEITLEEAFNGKEATIRIPTWESCETCSGSGAEPGSKPIICDTCSGVGRVRMQQGFFTVERTCPSCNGQGEIIKDPCKSCQGSGRKRKEKKLQVTIPAGVEDGMRIRLAGEGEAGIRGGGNGDLYVFISVKPHRFFQREGTNLFCRVPVSINTVALGGTVEVPTIEGRKSKVTIPAGTQTGQQFRLKGKGMSVLRAPSRGDMFIEVTVETPVNLSKKQKELLKEFSDGNTKKNNPKSSGFFDKVKELWEDLKD